MKRASIAFVMALVVAFAGIPAAHAGEGHDHGDAPAAPSANGPQRQPDGSVFLPKPAQRQLGVRTVATEAAELPRTISARLVGTCGSSSPLSRRISTTVKGKTCFSKN